MNNTNIGIRVNKVDNQEKTSGSAKYIADLNFDNMLYGKTIRSTKARAKIQAIHYPVLPKEYFIIDHNDVPGQNRVKFLVNDQPFLAEMMVNYIGEPIVLIVGPNRQKLKELANKITIEYQPLAAALTTAESLQCIGGAIFGKDNKFASYAYEKGDVSLAFKQAKNIETDEYTTGYQKHAYLENQGMIAVPEADDKVTVYGSMQCPYYIKRALEQALALPEEKVRIVQTTTGGAFGGKEDYPSILAGHAAIAAKKVGRPVAILYDGLEDMASTTRRHPAQITFQTALDESGKIIGMKIDVILDGGAYAGISDVVLQRSLFNITGVYHIQNLEVHGCVVATNTIPNGAFRGFGAPQAFFAMEMHMENLAKKLQKNPLDYKKLHMVKQGDSTATSGLFLDKVPLPEMLATIEKMSDYTPKYELYQKNGNHHGIGISLFLHGCGFTGSGERDIIKAKIKLRRQANSQQVEILAANVDMGQGLKTTFKKIVAAALAIPMTDIIFNNPDTDHVPDSGPTVASRSIMIVGKLLEDAARKLKARWLEKGTIEITQAYKQPERMHWDSEKSHGDAYPAYAWGINVVETTVDPLTLQVDVNGVWTVFDIGQAIDEQIIQGQIEGGVLQGLGYASMEVMTNDKSGKIIQDSLTNYTIPTMVDFGKVNHKLFTTYYKDGPFGAKGAGELTLIGAAPAYAAAVAQALKIHIDRLPVTPEYLLEVLQNENHFLYAK